MTDSGTPIQSQRAQFLVGGAKHGRGYVLLHPDHLTTVASPADIVGYVGVPMVFGGFAVPLFHTIGWLGVAIAALMGRQSGDAYNKWQAIRNAAAGGDGVTVIPLDLITGVQTTKYQ